jgi:hypothetical protein
MVFGILYVCAISVLLFFMYRAVWPYAKGYIIASGALSYIFFAIYLNNPVTALLPALVFPFVVAMFGIVFFGWKDALQGKSLGTWGHDIDGQDGNS